MNVKFVVKPFSIGNRAVVCHFEIIYKSKYSF